MKTEMNLKNFDPMGLYEKSVVCDPDAGEIVVLRPITVGGIRDADRSIRFFSSMMVQMRGMPHTLSFEIKASSLEEAVNGWAEAARLAGEEYVTETQDRMIRASLTRPAAAGLSKPN